MKLYEGGRLNRVARRASSAPTCASPISSWATSTPRSRAAPSGASACSSSWTSSASSGSSRWPTRSSPAPSGPCARRSAALRPGAYEYSHHLGRLRRADHRSRCRCEIAGDEPLGRLHRLLAGQPARRQRGDELHRGLHDLRGQGHREPRRAEQRGRLPRAPDHRARGLHPERAAPRARWPPATSSATSCPTSVAGALKQALPDRVMAEGSANIWGIQLSGKDRAKQPFVYTFFGSGGTGARPQQGRALAPPPSPRACSARPSRSIETLAPLLVERKALRDGSGGDGRFRGGLGQVLAFRVLSDDPATCSVLCDRTTDPGPGLLRRPARRARAGADQRESAGESQGRADATARAT